MNNTEKFPSISLDSIARGAKTVPAAEFQGSWRSIELQPDLFVPQSFSVGVLVEGQDGSYVFRVLEDHKKFECVYGARFPAQARFELLEYVRKALKDATESRTRANDVAFDVSNIRLSEPRFTSGASMSATAARLFEEIVVMAPHQPDRVSRTIDTPAARKLVNERLRQIAQQDYSRIVVAPENPVTMEVNGKRRPLDINLHPGNACGSVLSTVYATTTTVEFNLLRAGLDLTTYARSMHIEKPALFLLLPGDRLEAPVTNRIYDIISDQSWKLEREGVRISSFADEKELAQDLYEWAKPALAAA